MTAYLAKKGVSVMEFLSTYNEPAETRHPVDFIEPLPPSQYEMIFEKFGRLLMWLIAGKSTEQIGTRVLISIFLMRPDLAPAGSLAEIGRQVGIGRAGVDKLANQFRDNFTIEGLNQHEQEVWESYRKRRSARK